MQLSKLHDAAQVIQSMFNEFSLLVVRLSTVVLLVHKGLTCYFVIDFTHNLLHASELWNAAQVIQSMFSEFSLLVIRLRLLLFYVSCPSEK